MCDERINDVLKTLSDPKFDVESTADTPVGLKAVLNRVESVLSTTSEASEIDDLVPRAKLVKSTTSSLEIRVFLRRRTAYSRHLQLPFA